MEPTNVKNRRLQELGGSNFEIADGQPDIRSWTVKDESGKKIGKVKELLFDESSRKVRYIIQDLKDNDYDLESRRVAIPIGIAQLHENDDDVILPGITVAHLQSLPDYNEDTFTPEAEYNLRNTFSGIGGTALTGTALASTPGTGVDEDFYDHDQFNEENLYKNRVSEAKTSTTIPVIEEELTLSKREVATGGVRLKSRIIETNVEENITLRQENVRVERTAVDKPATSQDFVDSTVELTESAEIPVVSKEARVIEEITLAKDINEREETIKETVRSTEVDVEKTDKDSVTNNDMSRS